MNRLVARLRLELDRTLRGRPFVARAVRGMLTAEEYGALLRQLAALAATDGDLRGLARADAAALGQPAEGPVCPAVRWLAAAAPEVPRVRSAAARLAVAGTSWSTEAAAALAQTHPGASRFLDALAARSAQSAGRLDRWLARDGAEELLAYAELARGAVLALAAQLDLAWPAPVHVLWATHGLRRLGG